MNEELSPLDVPETPAVAHHARPRGSAAWVFGLTHGLLLTSGGLYWTFRGRFFDRTIYEAVGGSSWALMEAFDADVLNLVSVGVRFAGTLAVAAGLLVMVVSATAFRRFERWAWYAFWGLPFYVTLDLMSLAAYRALSPTGLVWNLALLGTALLALFVPYGIFFPSQESAHEAPPVLHDPWEERHA